MLEVICTIKEAGKEERSGGQQLQTAVRDCVKGRKGQKEPQTTGQFCQFGFMAVSRPPPRKLVPEGLRQGQPASPGLHSPFRWAGYPPASDLLEGGVSHFDAQGQQRGPHSHPQRGPQPAPPEIHPHPSSAPALLARHKHSVTGLGHLWKGRGQGVGLATADRCRPESIPDSYP